MMGSFLSKKLDFNLLLPKNTITLNNQSSNKKKIPKINKRKKNKKSIQLKKTLIYFLAI
jgi:hypothetical protein